MISRTAPVRLLARRLAPLLVATLAACALGTTTAAPPPVPALHTEEMGAGPTVVFLPGLTGTTAYYRPDVEPLATRFHVVLVDLLGFGLSPKPGGRYDVERHVDALRRALAGRGPVTLVGHSLGARLAVAYAARYPDDVRRLVLLGLPYFPDSGGAIAYARQAGWDRAMWTHRRTSAALFYLMHTLPSPVVARAAGGLPPDVVRESRAFTTRSATSSLWDAVFRYDPAADIAGVPARVPVVLVHGEDDATAPMAGAARVVERRPDWELVSLPGVDHHPMMRAPELILRLVADGAGATGRRAR